MKLKKLIQSSIIGGLLLSGCSDQNMYEQIYYGKTTNPKVNCSVIKTTKNYKQTNPGFNHTIIVQKENLSGYIMGFKEDNYWKSIKLINVDPHNNLKKYASVDSLELILEYGYKMKEIENGK